MKEQLLSLIFISAIFSNSAFGWNFSWTLHNTENTGYNGFKIGNSFSTKAEFDALYEMRLMYIGAEGAYSSDYGYKTFIHTTTGVHGNEAGLIQKTNNEIENAVDLIGHQFILAVYEKASGKYYFLSDTPNGEALDPFIIPFLWDDPMMDITIPNSYYPQSSTGATYKGAEIPSFCVWLAQYNLTQADLANISVDTVNQAFSVGANPTYQQKMSLDFLLLQHPTLIYGLPILYHYASY